MVMASTKVQEAGICSWVFLSKQEWVGTDIVQWRSIGPMPLKTLQANKRRMSCPMATPN